MKSSNGLRFALSGAVAGIFPLLLFKIIPLVLVFGVGPAVLGSIVVAAFSLDIPVSPWRWLLAILLSIPIYFGVFLAFATTMSYSQRHGLSASSVLSDMKPDVLLGLIVAVLIASVLLECLALLLSAHWSTSAALSMAAGGVASVACAYLAKVVYFYLAGPPEGAAQIVILLGPLFVLGSAIVAMVIGKQIEQSSDSRVSVL